MNTKLSSRVLSGKDPDTSEDSTILPILTFEDLFYLSSHRERFIVCKTSLEQG